jgi:hypothetical protein
VFGALQSAVRIWCVSVRACGRVCVCVCEVGDLGRVVYASMQVQQVSRNDTSATSSIGANRPAPTIGAIDVVRRVTPDQQPLIWHSPPGQPSLTDYVRRTWRTPAGVSLIRPIQSVTACRQHTCWCVINVPVPTLSLTIPRALFCSCRHS